MSSNKRVVSLRNLIAEINASGSLMCTCPDGQEYPIDRASMLNEFLALDRRDSTDKVLINTNTIDGNGIYEFTGNFHVPTNDGEYIISLRRLYANDLISMLNEGRYYLLDIESKSYQLHQTYDKVDIRGDADNAEIIFASLPVHADYDAEGYNKFILTVNDKVKMTLIGT
jgi:hypothetical protein